MSRAINRLTGAWFEFKGLRSDNLDILITNLPQREIPARNMKRTKVAGRDGEVRQSDDSYDDINVRVSFKLMNQARRNDVAKMLTGFGALRFWDEPEYVYDALIEDVPRRTFEEKHFDVQEYDVNFVCHPFKKLHTPASDIVFSSSGGTIDNPGTASSLPRVKIAGSGTFSVSIGLQTMFFKGVSGGGIIVDSELGDALTYDGALLANEKIGDSELFKIPPGNTISVTWIDGQHTYEGETVTGSVTSVTITPRWRYV